MAHLGRSSFLSSSWVVLAASLAFSGESRAEPAPKDSPEARPVIVELHSDDDSVSAEQVRAAIASELGVAAIGSGEPRFAAARGDVTVTYHRERRELAVTYHDAERGTFTRVVPAPLDPKDVPREAALLAGNLARNEADELLGPATLASRPGRETPPASIPQPPASPAHDAAPTRAAQPHRVNEDGPATIANPISAEVLLGYGFNDSNAGTGETLNLYGWGAGGRLGYTFPFHLYVGAGFVYHAGFKTSDLGTQPAWGRVAPFGLELGYAITLGPITLRPFVGAGVAAYDASYVSGSTFEKGSGLEEALWPGLSATYDIARHFFLGIDARYTIIFKGNDDAIVGAGHGSRNGLGSFATVGFRIPD